MQTEIDISCLWIRTWNVQEGLVTLGLDILQTVVYTGASPDLHGPSEELQALENQQKSNSILHRRAKQIRSPVQDMLSCTHKPYMHMQHELEHKQCTSTYVASELTNLGIDLG